MSGETTVGPNSASGRIKVCNIEIDDQTGEMQFIFTGGRDPLIVNISMFPQSVVNYAALRGITETTRDAFAGVKGDVDKARAIAKDRLDALIAGNWRSAREGSGEGQGALWIEAVARIKGWDLSTARTKLFADSVSDAQRKDIKDSPQVKKIVAEIRLEKAKAAVDAAAGEAAGSADALAAFG